MKIAVTRMFVRCTLVFAIVAAGILASGCASEQGIKKTPEQLKAEEEARRKAAEEEARRKAEAEAKAKAEAEAKAKAAAEAQARAKAEAEAMAKAEAEAGARRVGPVLFDYDKYNIRDDQKSALDKGVEKLKARPDFMVAIEGHCDERGTIEYNMALGQKRAESAKKFLVKAGIDAKRLTTVSYGKERPAADGHDESAWSKNRRDEFKITP